MKYFAEIHYCRNGVQGNRFTAVDAENEKRAREILQSELKGVEILEIQLSKVEEQNRGTLIGAI